MQGSHTYFHISHSNEAENLVGTFSRKTKMKNWLLQVGWLSFQTNSSGKSSNYANIQAYINYLVWSEWPAFCCWKWQRTCFYVVGAGVGESSREQKTIFLFLICVHWLIFVLVVVTNLYTKISPENLLVLHTAAKILQPCLSYSPNTIVLPIPVFDQHLLNMYYTSHTLQG